VLPSRSRKKFCEPGGLNVRASIVDRGSSLRYARVRDMARDR
jgi:hypothetical protein